MKNNKSYLIIGLLALVAGAFIYSIFKTSEPQEDQGPAAFFVEDGNFNLSFGKEFNTQLSAFPGSGKIKVFFDDSLVLSQRFTGQKISLTLPKGILKIGAHSLRVEAKNTTDERVLNVLSDIEPKQWGIEIQKEYLHNDSSFTQGLTFSGGKLYEGTGDPNGVGATMIAEVDLSTGGIKSRKRISAPTFGEGIAIVENELFQLTWQNNVCYVYNKNNFELLRQYNYIGEGWGLTFDGQLLIMSDGSEKLTFRDPKTFNEVGEIHAYTHEGAVMRLNELEFIDGLIYANVWTENIIAVIEPSTGRVIATIDATQIVELGKGQGEVLNGIAYNDKTRKIYLTGKYWSKLFEVSLSKLR